MSESNKAVIRRVFLDGIAGGNLDVIDETVTRDSVMHFPGLPAPLRGIEAVKEHIRTYLTAFPDITCTIEDLLADGDRVAARFTWQGTHLGVLNGIPATGRRARFTSIDIYRLADGKIAEQWVEMDGLAMMGQLGLLPEPAAV